MSGVEAGTLSVIISLISAGGGAYLGAYLAQKGKNLATREDIENIVVRVERTTKTAEAIKAEISGDLWVRQKRWDFRAKFYTRILDRLGEVRRLTRDLLWTLGSTPPAESSEAAWGEWQKRYDANQERLKQATRGLDRVTSLAGLFLGPEALEVLERLSADLRRRRREDEEYEDRLEANIAAANRANTLLITAARRDLLDLKSSAEGAGEP